MNADHPFFPQPGSRMCVCGEPDTSHPAPGDDVAEAMADRTDPEIDRMIALGHAERDVVNAAVHWLRASGDWRALSGAVARLLVLRAADTAAPL